MVWEGLRSGPKMEIQLNFRTAALVTLAPGGAVKPILSNPAVNDEKVYNERRYTVF